MYSRLIWLLTLLYGAPVVVSLWASWQTEEYSHGVFIPLLALLVSWHRLLEKKPESRTSWWGLPLLAVAGLLMAVGVLSALEPLMHYALLLTLLALALTLWGGTVVAVLMPAFGYLLFCIPLPRLIYVGLSQKLQLWSSMLGVWLIELFAIPVYREGNVIDLGQSKLQVVEACGGLRYLFPLMSFGFLVALLLKDSRWKRVIIFLSTIPITLGINALRIALIGITVHFWGDGMAKGLLHDMEGWTLFLFCLAILALESWIFLRIGHKGRFRFEYISLPSRKAALGEEGESPAPAIAALLLLVGMTALTLTGLTQRQDVMPEHPALAGFPQHIGEWKGRPVMIDQAVLGELRASDYFIEDYHRQENSPPINLFIAYYASQRVGTSVHSPANCIPGSGWQVDSSDVLTAAGSGITLSRLVIAHGSERQLVYYWFDERGRILTGQYEAKWYLLWDSIFLHRTDGALVRLITPLAEGEAPMQADNRLQNFLKIAYPEIKRFIPQ